MKQIIIFVVVLVSSQFFRLSSASDFSDIKVEMIASTPKTAFGDGPNWHNNCLLYVDQLGTAYTILRYCPEANKTYTAYLPGEPLVSFIIPVEGTEDEYAVGITHRVGIIRWNGVSPTAELLRIVLEVEECEKFKTNLINDGRADRFGRLYTGSRRNESCENLSNPTFGNLFRVNNDGSAVTLLKKLRVSNAMAFDDKTMYFIDSCALNVVAFDWDPHTGDISNSRVITDFRLSNGSAPGYFADGMTIDKYGKFIFVGVLGGSKLRIVNVRTREIHEIAFPVQQVISAAFGGENYDVLYVTTGNNTLIYVDKSEQAGHLFKVTGLKTRGKPLDKVRI